MDDNDIINIDDRLILAAGCPPDDDPAAQNRWHGSMIRLIVGTIHRQHPARSWDYLKAALDAWSHHVTSEVLATPGLPDDVLIPSHSDEVALLRGCPSDDLPQAQRRWAQSMTLVVAGTFFVYQPDLGLAEVRRALASIAEFVRSEGGPLTWEVTR